MTNKERMQALLDGLVPDLPPHWELVFQIHSTGIDGYQSIDRRGHMDIRQVRQQYPDWILMGNVACNMLQDTNEASIRNSVRYCMTYGGMGTRHIFSTSNCIFKGMPPQSYRIMVDEYRRMCKTQAQQNTPNHESQARLAPTDGAGWCANSGSTR